jgi:hypothetical protein
VVIPGDPASTSALGGALRAAALSLVEALDELEGAAGRARRRPGSTPPSASRAPALSAGDLGTLLGRTADELDRVGALLQSCTTGIVETAVAVEKVGQDAAAWGLVVDGTLVAEAPGPSRVDPADRLDARRRLQAHLNRVTSARARVLSDLARDLERSTAALAGVSDGARTIAG